VPKRILSICSLFSRFHLLIGSITSESGLLGRESVDAKLYATGTLYSRLEKSKCHFRKHM